MEGLMIGWYDLFQKLLWRDWQSCQGEPKPPLQAVARMEEEMTIAEHRALERLKSKQRREVVPGLVLLIIAEVVLWYVSL
jgi:hypothetical protein